MEENNSDIKDVFPRFIPTKVCGEDKLKGSSQDKLADAIAKHFKDTDSKEDNTFPRIIGIEGEWGSGKSNVVTILKDNKLKDNYYFFEYDAWGNQEDLQRRSILELLTSKLIKDNILNGKTTIKVKNGGIEKVTWEQKLEYLLARKSKSITEKYPKLNYGMASAALVAILTPIFTFISYTIKYTEATWYFSILSIIISALPVLIGLLVWCIAYHKNKKYGLDYLLAIYNDKIEKDICYETLSVDEPSVTEFKIWMNEISNFIGSNNKKKLVIVFDNMDRLPADKVKSLWSSINTFFAGEGFKNIWAIIPFDRKHLSCAFGEGDNIVYVDKDGLKTKVRNTSELTNLFIEKTFPIIYRVAPPIITDYREIFDKFFIEAFGNTEANSRETINRIYRIEKTNANIREIIAFINEMVSIKHQWKDEISLTSIAIFCLTKEVILRDNTASNILKGEYLNNIKKIIADDINLQAEISVLVYGVEKDIARQIPLTQYINDCITDPQKNDINAYSESNINFDMVLDEVVRDTDDANIDKLINCLSTLKRKNDNISRVWNYISDRKIKQPIERQEFPYEYKLMLVNLDQTHQQKAIDKLYTQIKEIKEFNGATYYTVLDEIEVFIKDKKIKGKLEISPLKVNPNIFIDYVNKAGDNYKKYEVETDSNELDSYLTSLLPDKLQYSKFPEIIKDDKKYNFNSLVKGIEENIDNEKITVSNCGSILEFYKYFCTSRPLPKKMSSSVVSQIYSQLSSSANKKSEADGFFDIFVLYLTYGNNVTFDEDKVPFIAERLDCYSKYGDMLINCINWNYPYLNKILNYMTVSHLGNDIQIVNTLKQFENIRTKINVSDEQLINQLDKFIENAKQSININNIQDIVPAKLYDVTTKVENQLTKLINDTALTVLKTISESDLYAQRNNSTTYYWHIVSNTFISHDIIQELPNNLLEFGLHLLKDVAFDQQSVPLYDYFSSIIDRIDKQKNPSIVTDIRNTFCNGQHNMSVQKFKLLEPWLREQGDLINRSEVAEKIIRPIISDAECRKIILNNQDFYAKVINNCNNSANNLRNTIAEMIKTSHDVTIIAFAKSIGVDINNKEK